MQARKIHIGVVLVLTTLWFGNAVAADQTLEKLKSLDYSPVKLNKNTKDLIKAHMNSRFNKYGGDDMARQDPKSQMRVKQLGFPDRRELKDVDVGDAFRVFRIQLNHIRAYKAEKDPPEKLLIPTEGVIVPIGPRRKSENLELTLRSFVTLMPTEKEESTGIPWRVGPVVNSPSLRSLIEAQKDLVNNKSDMTESDCQCAAIFYEAQQRYFLGYRTSTGEFWIRVLESGPGKLIKGEDRPAKEVFAELSKDAKGKRNKEYFLPGNPRDDWEHFQGGQ